MLKKKHNAGLIEKLYILVSVQILLLTLIGLKD